jgi:hypothetical protein
LPFRNAGGTIPILPGVLVNNGKAYEQGRLAMSDGETKNPGLISLLIARWEVSPLGTTPSTLSLMLSHCCS